jgi:hypothetical protein
MGPPKTMPDGEITLTIYLLTTGILISAPKTMR